ncbi:hypothetical protein [Amycolatopsis sp. NPDC051372]|uniref:hypothetical protein n=1 Tax=Amycolatopsis sp. NPDC051372 TaxID=3155669 RepID=UPI0034204749
MNRMVTPLSGTSGRLETGHLPDPPPGAAWHRAAGLSARLGTGVGHADVLVAFSGIDAAAGGVPVRRRSGPTRVDTVRNPLAVHRFGGAHQLRPPGPARRSGHAMTTPAVRRARLSDAGVPAPDFEPGSITYGRGAADGLFR